MTGTAMFYHLAIKIKQNVEKLRALLPKLTIQVVEKTNEFGPGYPFSAKQALPIHLISMCAQDMGIVAGNPKDFAEWLGVHWDKLQKHFSYLRSGHSKPNLVKGACDYYPRIVMGEYLKARFKEAVEIAQKLGVKVELYLQHEVVKLADTDFGLQLILKSTRNDEECRINAHRMLLATGHWTAAPSSQDELEATVSGNYFPAAWPAKALLEKIPTAEPVAVIGTSLSACDSVLTLFSDGTFTRNQNDELAYGPSNASRKVTLYSRHGLLPKVHGWMGTYRNAHFNPQSIDRLLGGGKKFIRLKKVFSLLNTDLEIAYGHPINWQEVMAPKKSPLELLEQSIKDAKKGDGSRGELLWQTVLHQSFPMLKNIYLHLTAEDRERFDKEFDTLFFIYAATLPLIIAEKILALMKAGYVKIVKLGHAYTLAKDKTRGGFEFIYRDNDGRRHIDYFNYVVNATGQKKSYESCPSGLAKNLLQSGQVQIEELFYGSQEGLCGRNEKETGCLGQRNKTKRLSYKTGALKIHPGTHQILLPGTEGKAIVSPKLFAVGAMTRGQIINASMSYACALATAKIADQVVGDLIENC